MQRETEDTVLWILQFATIPMELVQRYRKRLTDFGFRTWPVIGYFAITFLTDYQTQLMAIVIIPDINQ